MIRLCVRVCCCRVLVMCCLGRLELNPSCCREMRCIVVCRVVCCVVGCVVTGTRSSLSF